MWCYVRGSTRAGMFYFTRNTALHSSRCYVDGSHEAAAERLSSRCCAETSKKFEPANRVFDCRTSTCSKIFYISFNCTQRLRCSIEYTLDGANAFCWNTRMNHAIMIMIMKNCNDFQVHRCIVCSQKHVHTETLPFVQRNITFWTCWKRYLALPKLVYCFPETLKPDLLAAKALLQTFYVSVSC